MITVSQDPDAHLFYEVDWSDWLALRQYTPDQIVNITSALTGPGTITNTRIQGAAYRVWLQGVAAGKKSKVTVTIQMPQPTPTTPPVTDDYSFYVFGKQR